MTPIDLKAPLGVNILILKIGGLWPDGDKYFIQSWYTVYATISFVFIVLCHNLSQIINVYFIYDQLETLTASIVVMLTEVMGMVKFILFYKNIKIVKGLMKMLDEETFQPKNPKQRILTGEALNNWKRIYVVFSISAAMTLLLWGLFPLLDKSYKVKKLPFIAWYPFNYQISPFYEFTYVYQIVANYFIAFTNQNIDAFISALLMYIATESDLLCDNLRKIKFEEKGKSHLKFILCVKHHQEILRFSENTNKFLDIMTFGQFMTSVISICMTMFQLTVVEPLTPEFYTLVCCQSAVFTQVFIYCWFGNEVIIKSDNISYSACESGFWIDSSVKSRKDLIFFLMKCQRPIKLRAVSFYALSLGTFTSILRSSWSYFALLRQINNQV